MPHGMTIYMCSARIIKVSTRQDAMVFDMPKVSGLSFQTRMIRCRTMLCRSCGICMMIQTLS